MRPCICEPNLHARASARPRTGSVCPLAADLPSASGRAVHVEETYEPMSSASGRCVEGGWPSCFDTMSTNDQSAMGSTLDFTECISDVEGSARSQEDQGSEVHEETSNCGSVAGRSALSASTACSALTGTTAKSCREALLHLQMLAADMAAASDLSKVTQMPSKNNQLNKPAVDGVATSSTPAHRAAAVLVASRMANADREVAATFGDRSHSLSESRPAEVLQQSVSDFDMLAGHFSCSSKPVARPATTSPLWSFRRRPRTPILQPQMLPRRSCSSSPTATPESSAVSSEVSLRNVPLPPVPDGLPPMVLGCTWPPAKELANLRARRSDEIYSSKRNQCPRISEGTSLMESASPLNTPRSLQAVHMAATHKKSSAPPPASNQLYKSL